MFLFLILQNILHFRINTKSIKKKSIQHTPAGAAHKNELDAKDVQIQIIITLFIVCTFIQSLIDRLYPCRVLVYEIIQFNI